MRNAPLILPAALVLAACAATPDVTTGTTMVNVTATYRERIMLPPGHVHAILTNGAPAWAEIVLKSAR